MVVVADRVHSDAQWQAVVASNLLTMNTCFGALHEGRKDGMQGTQECIRGHSSHTASFFSNRLAEEVEVVGLQILRDPPCFVEMQH